ncbi:anaerobic dimethyl sulfoxide reductase subunit A [Klebsiella pneumoniae]|nr:anaerobic dimethyl sulfoxide reductase subunit A [Klebsiella pneumoniae]
MSNQESPGGVSRRALLKSTALGSLALAAGGLTLPFTLRRAAAAVQQATGDTTRIVWGACSVNCGSRCALRLHVRDDEVVYVETDNTTATATIRSAPACAGVRFAGASIIRIALTIP